MSASDAEPPSLTADGHGNTLANTYKRSFDQLDIGEDVQGEPASSSAAGIDRHKRARSESRSEAGSSSGTVAEPDSLTVTLEQLSAMPGPSRMDPDNSSSDVDSPSRYELSMERFSNFEEHIQPLRETPEASEHNSQALSQTPIDEDEIMAHLFGGPDSSQSLDDEQEAFSSPPPESTPQFVHPFSSTPTAQPSVGAGANTSEHEVVVISDSDDDVQIVEHPPQRSGSESAGDRTAIRQHLVGLADPWADLPPIPNPWEDSAEDHLSSSRTRIRSPQTIHNRSASSASSPPTNRRFSLPSISEAGLSLGSSAPWGTGSSTYTQGPSSSSLSLTLIERDMQRFRRLEEVRRRVASTQEVMDRASNAEEIRRLRQIRERACPPVGRPISQPASSTAVRPTTSAVLEGLGTRVENASRMVHLQPTATELGYAPSSESMRRMMREVTSRVARIAPPVTTSSTVERAPRSDGGNSEQRRRSLVMEGLFSDNPELLNNLRPATRRAPQYAPGTATSASASRPASPQVDRRDDQLLEPRASMSRPPPWMVSALPLTSAETRGDDRPLSPSSTSSSISSFVTATSSLGDSDSSAALSGYTVTGSHAPVVASPLRQVFVASPDSTPPTSSARLTVQRDDMNIGGIDMRDVASRVHSLTGVLTEMASSPQASVGIRDAALRLVSSGNALMRAIDDQMHMNSTSGAALSTAASANIAENDRAIAETDVSPTLSAIDSLGVSTISDRPDRNSSLRHRLGAMSTGSSQRSRPAAFVPISSTSSRGPSTTPLSSWRSAPAPFLDPPVRPPSSSGSRSSAAPRRSMSVFGHEEDLDSRHFHDFAGEEYIDSGPRGDRWTQARQRRRELQDALLAEESRMRGLRRPPPRGDQPSSVDIARDGQSGSPRMDIDSEDEVEVLFNSRLLGSQDPMDISSESVEASQSRSAAPLPTITSTNNTASRTVLRPLSSQQGDSSQTWRSQPFEFRRPSPAAAPHQVIDLNAYHDGPFRGALARAVEASRQTEHRLRQHQTRTVQAGPGNAGGRSSNLQNTDMHNAQSAASSTPTTTSASTSENPRRQNARYSSLFDDLEASIMGMQGLEDDLAQLQRLRPPVQNSSGARSPNRPRSPPFGEVPSDSHTRLRHSTRVFPARHATITGAGTGGRRHTPAYMEGLTNIDDISLRLRDRWLVDRSGRFTRRGVPQNVIDSLQSGTYGGWANADTETQCPICFEDYEASDAVLRLPKCKHWFHKPCIQEWFKTASTCPICRDRVGEPSDTSPPLRRDRARRPAPPGARGFSELGSGARTATTARSPPNNPFSPPFPDLAAPNHTFGHASPVATEHATGRDISRQTPGAAWREVQQRYRMLDRLGSEYAAYNRSFRDAGGNRHTGSAVRAAESTTAPATSASTANDENVQEQHAQAHQTGEGNNNAARRNQERRFTRSDSWWDDLSDFMDM